MEEWNDGMMTYFLKLGHASESKTLANIGKNGRKNGKI